jgi:hypothetical protein
MQTETIDATQMSFPDILLWIFTLSIMMICVVGLLRKLGVLKKTTYTPPTDSDKSLRTLERKSSYLESHMQEIKTSLLELSEENRKLSIDVRKLRMTITIMSHRKNDGSK